MALGVKDGRALSCEVLMTKSGNTRALIPLGQEGGVGVGDERRRKGVN